MSDESSSRNKSKSDVGVEASASGALRRWVIMRHTPTWQPPTDVYEYENRLIVMVEIAGMRDNEFNVTLHSQRLIISGVRQRMAAADAECAYHQLEIPFGEFRTEVSLPWPVVRTEVSAIYQDGLLRVELVRATTQKVQIVNVDTDE